MNKRPVKAAFFSSVAMLLMAVPVAGAELPGPDGKPADMSKPVQVYVLLGQSNMVGAGRVKGGDGSLEHAVKNKGLYPYLVDDAGKWTERKDVRFARVMYTGGKVGDKPLNNQWLTVAGINKIGPELGIGHHLGHAVDAPVLILKSCIGNRGLGYSLLPPGIFNCSFSQTPIEGWTHELGFKGGEDAFTKSIYRSLNKLHDPATSEHKTAWEAYGKAVRGWAKESDERVGKGLSPNLMPKIPGEFRFGNRDATWLYNAKTHPMAPYAIRGVIWNQGYDGGFRENLPAEWKTPLIVMNR